jgi:hypothetical protein
LDIQRITNLLNDLYRALHRSAADDPDLGVTLAVEASKHEPHI